MSRKRSSVLVLGAGGHAKVALDIFRLQGVAVHGVIDDDKDKWGTEVEGIPVIGGSELVPFLFEQGIWQAFVAIGNQRVRRDKVAWLAELGYSFPVCQHPQSIVAASAKIEGGAMLAAGAIVNSSAQIGAHAILNTAATVDHDGVIEQGVHLSPGVHLGGQVRVGSWTHVGIGSSVIQEVEIGRESIIGAGSVVVRSLPDRVKAYGVPARVIESLVEGDDA